MTGAGTRSDGPAADLEADFVVVGSGAGGGPLACRLATAGHRVILLEAGGRHRSARTDVPAFHGHAAEDPDISWTYFVRRYLDDGEEQRSSKHVEGKGTFYPRAATVGGCTVHNALITVAPHDHDWDHLAVLMGDESWRPHHMRGYFRRLEHCHYVDRPGADRPPGVAAAARRLAGVVARGLARLLGVRVPGGRASGGGDGHGFDGWLHTNRADPWLLGRDLDLAKLVARTAWQSLVEEAGGTIRRFDEGFFDPNDAGVGDTAEGFVLTPICTHHGRRHGPRQLIEETQRLHPDRLVVVTDALATRVRFDTSGAAPRAVGVDYLHGARLYRADPSPAAGGGTPRTAHARLEVIVAAGAFNTPQLLMLSGVGPADELARHGIPLLIDLPGVGANLQDRYEVAVVHRMRKEWELIRTLSFAEPAPGDDPDPAYRDWLEGKGVYTTNGVVAAVVKRSDDRLPVPDLFVFGVPADFRGYYPGYAADSFAHRDRFTWAVLKAHTDNRGGRVRLRSADPRDVPDVCFHYFHEGTDTVGRDLDAVVEGVKFARRAMQGWPDAAEELVPGPAVATDDELRDFVRREAWGHHASCSCAMGPDGDPAAVLDERLRVRGVDGLRVVDASVFPRIPGFFIVSAVYMVSEKAADMILADHATALDRARRTTARARSAVRHGAERVGAVRG